MNSLAWLCCIVCSHDKRLIAKVCRNFSSVVVALLFSLAGKRVHLAGFNFLCYRAYNVMCQTIVEDERNVIESVLYALMVTEQKHMLTEHAPYSYSQHEHCCCTE